MSIDELIEHLEALRRHTNGGRTVGVLGRDSTGAFHSLPSLASAFTVYPSDDEDPRTGRGTGIGRQQEPEYEP